MGLEKSDGYYLKKIQQSTAFETAPEDHVYEYLRNLSNLSPEMNADGSSGINFDWVVPLGTVYKKFQWARINFSMTDGGMGWGEFGGLGSALANGILLQVLDQNLAIKQDFNTATEPITINDNFANLAGTDGIFTAAAGDDGLPIRFTISKSGNKMTLYPGWRIRLRTQDDLSDISFFRTMVQGILRK